MKNCLEKKNKPAKVCLSETMSSDAIVRNSIAFFVGLFATMGCVYVFRIGNTYISIAFFFALVCLVGFLLSRNIDLIHKRHPIDKSVGLYAAIASLSFVMTVSLCALGGLRADAALVPFRGYAVLLCCIVLYVVVVLLGEKKRYVIYGLATGMIANFVICLLAYFAFKRGSWFSLYELFPQPSFFIGTPFANWDTIPAGAEKIAQYRPQGFFLECSHLMIFLIGLSPLVIVLIKNKFLKLIIIIFVCFSCVTSKSPNAFFCSLKQ